MRLPLITLAIGAVFVFWLLWAFQAPLLQSMNITWESSKFGAWGDTFGAFNALFGALGFGAILWTLILQKEQLQENQYQQYVEQFDKSFFQLLALLREARSQVLFRHSTEYQKSFIYDPEEGIGLSAFLKMWREVYARVTNKNSSRNDVVDAYNKYVHGRYESTLGPYFRLFYTMLRRISDDRVLKQEDRERYGNLLRSQITSYELAVAAVNGLSEVSKDFDQLLVEFRFLKYLPGRRRVVLQRYYPAIAFESRDDAKPRLFFRRISN